MSQDLDSLYEDSDEQLGTGTLSFCKEPRERSRTSEHIQSWRNARISMDMEGESTNGVPDAEVTPGSDGDSARQVYYFPPIEYDRRRIKMPVLYAEIIEAEDGKRYVAYTVKIVKPGNEVDPNPAFIRRRYNDFLDLYNNLRREHPALMSEAFFPKKVLMGNFGHQVMRDRRVGFENFLLHLSKEYKLYQSASFAEFMQGAEQREAKTWILKKRYDEAVPLLENSFRILNKFYTERHPYVMTALCRLVACSAADSDGQAKPGGCAERFAELALRRFKGISDSDLLQFYVPLLQLCVHLWWTLGKDKQELSDELERLKRRGIKVDGCDALLDALLKEWK